MKKQYGMYDTFYNGSTYDMTSESGKESDYNMYENSHDESECGKDHIHVGPLVIEVCHHEDGMHLCIYDSNTGKQVAETDVTDHSMEEHFNTVKENMDQIHEAHANMDQEDDQSSAESIEDMEMSEKPFHGYSEKKHSKSGGLNDSYRKKYNRETGSNLKRPVTGKVKAGSKAAGRRKSFCARMSGTRGPTSKDGKLTPKGAALKRWKCSKSEDMNKSQGGWSVHRADKNEDESLDWSHDSGHADEHSASVRARKLYQDGVYSVKVKGPDGKESSKWAKPEYAKMNKSEKLKSFMAKVESKRTLEHYSPTQGLPEINPKFKGSGVDSRVKGRDTEHPHSFYYKPGAQKENLVTANARSKYEIEIPEEAQIYDIGSDPMQFKQKAKEMNGGALNFDHVHQMIKESGHHGFHDPGHHVPEMQGVVALYHSQPVKKETKLE